MWELATVIGLVTPVFLFSYSAFKLNDEHIALKLFFFLLSFGFLIGAIASVIEMNNSVSVVAVYKALIYITIFVAAYFIIFYIYKLFKGIKIKNEENV